MIVHLRTSLRPSSALAVFFTCVVATETLPRARAQTGDAPPREGAGSATEGTASPPRLEHPVEVPYPPEASAARAEGETLVLITIGADGVLQACVTEVSSGREDLDQALCAALASATFVPARQGDTPIAARIRFSHRFTLPPPPPETVTEDEAEIETVTEVEAEIETEATITAEAEHVDVTADDGELSATAIVRVPTTVALRRSAESVHVIELEEAARESANLGEVLARQQGIGVRRSGGLGSAVRFSLNGLTDDQIRFFIDGVPLDWMGFPLGIGDVPVNLIHHVEVYRGVVPVRFGSDALGGAVNLATNDPAYSPNASVSYQGGSFGTHRLTLDGGHLFARSGFYVRARAFVDRADNDYPIRVTYGDATGAEVEATVRRFHDGYASNGGSIEIGVTDAPFADRLSLRAFVTDYTKEIQHNVSMEVPYGEVEYGERSSGVVARYDNAWDRARLGAVFAYGYSHTFFTDVSDCTYDWYGRCTVGERLGEIGRAPTNTRRRFHAAMLRATGEYALTESVDLRVALSPTLSTRAGEELADPEGRISAVDLDGDFITFVGGSELEARLFDDRLELIGFAKYYSQSLSTSVIAPSGNVEPVDNAWQSPGVGSSLRWSFSETIYAKASYEWATRLLRPAEIFGDGAQIYPNPALRPEVSQNANLGLTIEGFETGIGVFRADVNLFLRRPDRLVVLFGRDDFYQYYNVNRAQSIGVELAAGWTSRRDYVALDANFTYQDFRNVSAEGQFGAYVGDRIPNRPYLFANATARLQVSDFVSEGDRISLHYYLRYVHSFFRNWESIGADRPDIKQTIDSQLVHSATVSYLIRHEGREIATSIELQNFTDARVFDTFGIQRPGRTFYFKVTAEL